MIKGKTFTILMLNTRNDIVNLYHDASGGSVTIYKLNNLLI